MTKTANLGLTLMAEGQLQPEVPFNEDMQILDYFGSGVAQFGNNTNTTSGLTYGYYGGRIYSNGANINIANGTIGLTASATNYVQRTAAGVVSVNTTGYTAGLIPMATVVTGTSSINAGGITDTRPATFDMRGAQSVAVSNANITLTDAQVNCRILRFTGTLTSNVVVTLPAYQQEWVMSNETSGSFSLQVQTASGSPITLTQGASSILYGNGSILVAASSAGAGGSSGAVAVTIGTGVTLTPLQAANAIIRVQGAMTANAALTFPSGLVQVWEISNETTGAFALTALVSGSAATPIPIAQGFTGTVWSDGADLHVVSPAGAAGGDLTGSYPNPTLVPSGATAGTYNSPQLTVDAKGRVTAISGIGGAVATLPANPFVSGTVYQNTESMPLLLQVPVTYNPTGSVAATLAVALGPTSTPPTTDTETEVASASSGRVRTRILLVPPGWYYSFTTANATIGTASGFTGSTSYSGIGPSDFSEDPATTTGLTFGYTGGRVRTPAGTSVVAAGTITLTASATNYVELGESGTMYVNQTGFTAGRAPIRQITTGASSITADADARAWSVFAADFQSNGSVPMTGDLNMNGFAILDYLEQVAAVSATTATTTLDLATARKFNVTLGANTTLAFSNVPTTALRNVSVTVDFIQDATGSRVLTLPSGTKTDGGAGITLSTAANAIDTVVFTYDVSQGYWKAALAGKGWA